MQPLLNFRPTKSQLKGMVSVMKIDGTHWFFDKCDEEGFVY